jgi:hypothetical protein
MFSGSLFRVGGNTPQFSPLSLSPFVWLDATQETGYSDTDAVSAPTDWSGNGRAPSQATSGSRPKWRSAQMNGRASFEFDGTDDFWEWASSTFTTLLLPSAEIFIVYKVNAIAGDKCGLMLIGGDGQPRYPFTDNNFYDTFGTTTRKDGIAHSETITNPTLYNARSATNAWSLHLNGTQYHSTGTNTVGWNANALLGYNFHQRFAGYVSELFLTSVLGSTDRSNLKAYYAAKYGLTLA